MNIPGFIRGFVMQITCWVSNFIKVSTVFLMVFSNVSCVYAATETVWVGKKGAIVQLQMADERTHEFKLPATSAGVFYDVSKHRVEALEFMSVLRVYPSNSENPEGFCGSGNEVWLSVYRVDGPALIKEQKVLVSSCLRSISLASQNSGASAQDTDFSSVQWGPYGFSIEWFSNVDAVGRPLQSSSFVWHGDAFLQHEVLNQETPQS